MRTVTPLLLWATLLCLPLLTGCQGEKDGDLVVPTAEQMEPGENTITDPELRERMGGATPVGGG